MTVEELSRKIDLLQAQLTELYDRFESVPRLAEALVRHEDELRAQDEGEDFVEGL